MKKLLLLLLALLLTGCSIVRDPLNEAITPLAEGMEAPQPDAPDFLISQDVVTLWFRYLDEPLLAPETRALSLSPDRPMEVSLLTALLAGPDVQSTELTGLFPAGTRVLSTVRQGRTLFVTLSRQIMDAYPDEPQDWRRDPYWSTEALLRRRLCMQSLVATITENCDIDTVQVLVEQHDVATDSLRLRQRYYLTTDGNELADALLRNDQLLLSPGTAMSTILTLWQKRDWPRLQRYMVSTEDEETLPSRLDALPHLLNFTLTGPTITDQTATFTMTATVRGEAGTTTATSRVLRLYQERGLWRVTFEQLAGWLEVSP